MKVTGTGQANKKLASYTAPFWKPSADLPCPTVPFKGFLKHELPCSVPCDLTILATDDKVGIVYSWTASL